MPIVVYGISHKIANLAAREHLTCSLEDIPQALSDIRANISYVEDVMLLSTCQRTEYYFYFNDSAPTIDLSYLKNKHVLDAYIMQDKAALIHLMRVANGLDSSLLGEPQILGQLKAAYASAKASGFLGKHLEQVMQFIFAAAKKIRSQTLIGQGSCSLPYAAVSLGKCIFSELPNPYILLIGAGSVIQNILNHIIKKKNLTIVIANRSYEKAVQLSEKYGVTPCHFSDIYKHLSHADIVISATSSPQLILKEEAVKNAVGKKPIFMVDMAVPRDIAPEVAHLKNVFLYNIDDLHNIIQNHLDARQQSASEAAFMIDEQVQTLIEKMQLNHYVSIIQGFRSQLGLLHKQLLDNALLKINKNLCIHSVISEVLNKLEVQMRVVDPKLRENALIKAKRQLNLGKAPAQVLSEISRSFMNQLLHKPTLELKNQILRGV